FRPPLTSDYSPRIHCPLLWLGSGGADWVSGGGPGLGDVAASGAGGLAFAFTGASADLAAPGRADGVRGVGAGAPGIGGGGGAGLAGGSSGVPPRRRNSLERSAPLGASATIPFMFREAQIRMSRWCRSSFSAAGWLNRNEPKLRTLSGRQPMIAIWPSSRVSS